MAFRIEVFIPMRDFSDTFYFKELPTREALIQAIYEKKTIANEHYSSDYNLVISALRMDERFPDHFPSNTAMVGYPLQFGCAIDFWQFNFKD